MKLKVNKWFAGWLAVLLLVFAVNHLEYACRNSPAATTTPKANTITVREEHAMLGHNTIGIAENSLADEGGKRFLRFGTLGSWDFDPAHPTAPPQAIQALSGGNFSLVGFMYPLEAGTKVKNFCLLRSTQTCCYGPRPQYNQYVLVNMAEAVPFERLVPVVVEGKFFADAKPEDGYIYRLEGSSVAPAVEKEVEINAAEAARQAKLELFDFAVLESERHAAEGSPPRAVSSALLAEDGRQVVLEGFQLGQGSTSPPSVLVGRFWWDGVAKGTPPDLFNAVRVFPQSAADLPQAWQQKVVFTGTLRVTREAKDWPAGGVLSLREAARGVPGQNGPPQVVMAPGPLLSVESEMFILFGFLVIALARWSSKARQAARAADQQMEDR